MAVLRTYFGGDRPIGVVAARSRQRERPNRNPKRRSEIKMGGEESRRGMVGYSESYQSRCWKLVEAEEDSLRLFVFLF